MSLLNMPKLRHLTSPLKRLRGRGSARTQRGVTGRAFRQLQIDPLEQRQMLSLSPGHLGDVQVNQQVSYEQNTSLGQSVAVDHDGDFVVTWTRYDEVLDANGDPIIDPDTGEAMTDANVYARYFTDEVQRITLPDGVLDDSVPNAYGRFNLTYGGNEIQKLTITATYEPYVYPQETIAGSFTLGFDVNGDGSIGPPGQEQVTIVFDETAPLEETAQNIQDSLQGLPGDVGNATDVRVEALNPHEFLIHFGDATEGTNQPQLTVESIDFDSIGTSGFMPAVRTSTVREPIELASIPVSPNNPALTATAIEQAFVLTSDDGLMGPIDFPPADRIPGGDPVPAYMPEVYRSALPYVTVTPVSTTEFDIRFGGDVNRVDPNYLRKYGADSAKQDHPELVISSVTDERGNSLIDSPQLDVTTLKEPSPEFRVNDPEPDNPFTPLPDLYDQVRPAVALDADGEFIITWEGEVPNSANPGSVSDIFARRFRAAGVVEEDEIAFHVDTDLDGVDDPIQSVVPLGNQFQVNTFTANAQFQPTVNMDDDGNFVIAWANMGQDISFFNGIVAQRYNREGDRLGSEWLVNTEETGVHFDPYVGVSSDGHFAVTWSLTQDPNYVIGAAMLGTLGIEVYDPDGQVLLNQFPVGGAGGRPSVAFDMDNNFVLAWDEIDDADNIGITSVGVRGQMFQLYDDTGQVTGVSIRDIFRGNSASLNPADPLIWPTGQYANQVAVDADGDLAIAFQGFGPDASEFVDSAFDATGAFQRKLMGEINANNNADLLVYFDPAVDALPIFYYGNNGDVDGTIEEVLIYANSIGANSEQLGRLRAILDDAAGLLRGDASAVMFSRWDADPQLGQINNLFSDSVANAMRDGENARVMLVLDDTVANGSFELGLVHPAVPGFELVTVNVVSQNNVLLPGFTADAIEAALQAAQRTGVNWPGPAYAGSVEVRYMAPAEVTDRMGTPWEIPLAEAIDYVFEITFIGEVHDTPMALWVNDSNLTSAPVQIPEEQTLSINVTQDGQFALSIGGNQTNDILFDSSDPIRMAATIQTALAGLNFPGVMVTYDPLASSPPNFVFDVIFLDPSDGQNIPDITQATADDNANYQPSDLFQGQISSVEVVQGATVVADAPFPMAWDHTFGDYGTYQWFSSIGMEPDGDFVMAWTQTNDYTSNTGANTSIYFRTFNESTDTAGPMVTDFLLPDGNRLEDGGQVIDPLQTITVVFDEDMMQQGVSDIKDPRNWALLRDGIELLDGISQIYFGMNKAHELNPAIPASNKWEAVLLLDGNGASTGVVPLADGHYELVAMNSLRDRAGNPLERHGFGINGQIFDREFDVLSTAGGETIVNDVTDGDQDTHPVSPQPIAHDADGDYVVVFESDFDEASGTGQEGIFFKMYNADSTEYVIPNTFQPLGEVLVTDDPTATYASVARDGDGDFVVTWSAENAATGWDVWYRRYDATGTPLDVARLANSTTEDNQRNSTVAMDVDGDFVITWQSLNQDGSGYGIYAQRFDPAGAPIGGVNEIQIISFYGQPEGTFQLHWDGDPNFPDVSVTINYTGNTFTVAEEIQAALEGLGAEVEVEAVSLTEVLIRFVGADGSTNVPMISIVNAQLTGDPGARIEIATAIEGGPGEFRVNDTTANNQLFPTVALAAEGGFVISWTGTGQDGDAAYETNIYAKVFPSNDVFRQVGFQADAPSFSTQRTYYGDMAKSFLVAADDPTLRIVTPGSGFDGVVQVNDFGAFAGSGSLLTSGMHILTAAHVVSDFFGNPMNPDDVSVTFNMPTGPVTIQAAQVLVHPSYNGQWFLGGDVAIITLSRVAPAAAERYDIYRNTNELGQLGDKYGYGTTGIGLTGGILPPDDNLRLGQNLWEALGGTLSPLSPVPLSDDLIAYDFDSGLAANDAFDFLLGMPDLGSGATNECSGAPGDSGGPTFLGGLIAGVVSGGVDFGGTWDVSPGIDSSFGDVGFDTRVSIFADWIDAAVSLLGGPEILVNQNIASDQKWSSVALDADGDFVITWTSYGQDGVGNGYGAGVNGENGVFARRFDPDGTPVSDEFQVNTYGDDNQQHSRVAMDADGDFVITWESFQDRSDPSTGDPDSATSYGIYAQRYVRAELLTSPFVGPNGELGGELAVNDTKVGDQRYPGIGMDDTGDFVIAWSGNGTLRGQQDDQGIFFQRYMKTTDDAGPMVTDVFNVVPVQGGFEFQRVMHQDVLEVDVSQFVVNFGEELSTTGGQFGTNSVENTSNWQLTRDGAIVFGAIYEIDFLYNVETNKYEAILTFDGQPNEPDLQTLGAGTYVLTARDSIEDIYGNPLDGDFDGTPGGFYNLEFTIFVGGVSGVDLGEEPGPDDVDIPTNNLLDSTQREPAVASDAEGNYVVVWNDVSRGVIVGQRKDRFGADIGAEFTINDFTANAQRSPDVAMDANGNFVVVWEGWGDGDAQGIYARVFDAFGSAQGGQFLVNTLTANIQDDPHVAMDDEGNFVVTWSAQGHSDDPAGVYARRYDFRSGQPAANPSGEFRVNTHVTGRQADSDVAMAGNGNFVVVWASDGQDGSEYGVYGQRYNASAQTVGGEFRVNTTTTNDQLDPAVAMDANGDFVVVWSSLMQDGDGWGVYGRPYSAGGSGGSVIRINQTTAGDQETPAVGMDANGNFVVTWSTYNQDNINDTSYGIYRRRFSASGSGIADPETGASGEIRVNRTVAGDQVAPDIAVDDDGDFAVVWVGPDSDFTGVFDRAITINPPTGSYIYPEPGGSGGENRYIGPGAPPVSGPSTLLITGTSGDDLFEFVGGSTVSSWVVKLNGVVQDVDPNTVSVSFTGRGGNDTVYMTGSGGDDVVELWPDQGTLVSADYSVNVSQVETIWATGGGGNDEATLYDAVGSDDVFTGYVGGGQIVSAAVDIHANEFEAVVAYASKDPNDIAKLYDSPGKDEYICTPQYGHLIGDGFSMKAIGFAGVHGYATQGGFDVAKMFDSYGDDYFYGSGVDASLYGDGFYNRGKYFEQTHAYASHGGFDQALLIDTAGDDIFYSNPVEGVLYGDGYLNRGKHFDVVVAEANNGGTDIAYMEDSAGDDLLITGPVYAELTGNGFRNIGTNFDQVYAYGSDGWDVAKMFDSPGDDRFYTTAIYGALTGDGFHNQAEGFSSVNAYATAGGKDIAQMWDSAEDDIFYGTPTESSLYHPGLFHHRAKHFEQVHAYATLGGNDRADLYGSDNDDWYYGDDDEAVLYDVGNTFLNRGKFFEEVNVYTDQAGTDTALLIDATLEQGHVDLSKAVWLYDFEACLSKAGDDEPVSEAVDEILTAYWP